MSARALWPGRTFGGPFAKALASRTGRPRIFALTSPTRKTPSAGCQLLAIPEHTLRWSKIQAIATTRGTAHRTHW